jgi:site-specific recombinase XerD
MNTFKDYLLENRKSYNTARGYNNIALSFELWAQSEGIEDLKNVSYKAFLSFIDYCRTLENSPHTIRQKVLALKHYFKYLKGNNPAEEISLRASVRKLPVKALTREKLDAIYQSYDPPGATGRRNKLMLSLVIYQGVTSGELMKIESKDVKLEKGTIYIPTHYRANSRTLELKAFQLLEMQNYLLKSRPQIIKEAGLAKDQLFPTTGTSKVLNNTISLIIRTVRKTTPELTSLMQIRTSVIQHWVKQFGLRKAQYMAGHKYVSSTERYKQDHLEDLTNELDRFHPF